jgi:hypothetical protein
MALVLQAMRFIRSQVRRGQSAGLFIARGVPLICFTMLALRLVAKPLHLTVPTAWAGDSPAIWCSVGRANLERAAMLARLEEYPGLQLAIVRYSRCHNLHHEWVYNGADIDKAKVVWARDMGPDKSQELVDYFRDPRVWLVDVKADDAPARLLPYTAARDRLLPTPR